MSILDGAGESAGSSESETSNESASTGTGDVGSGKTIDQLNQEFQASNTGENKAASDAAAQDHTPDPANEAAWYYDDNTPGVGDRPEWLKDKYKSAAEQAKAYNELDKKLGKFKGAPDEYDLTLPELPDFKFEDGDPVLAEFLDFAKESNASQEFVTKALEQYIKAQQFNAPDPEAEIEKLGVNAKAEIQQVTEWAGQRLDKGEFEVFKSMITTADSFKVIQKLRRAATSQTEIPAVKNGQSAPQVSERQVLEMIGDERFNTDPLYRAEVEAKAAKIWG